MISKVESKLTMLRCLKLIKQFVKVLSTLGAYFLSKIEGIGGGDFILLASAGALFGYQMLSFVVLLGSLISLLIYLFKKSDYKGKVPLGSGIALASFFIIIIQITLLKSIL